MKNNTPTMSNAEFRERIKGICGIRPANPLVTRTKTDRGHYPGDLEIWKGSGGARIAPSVITYRLNNGRDVLARMNEGEPWPFMFANRTQANRRQVALGDDWEVIRPGRPFYVAKKVVTCQHATKLTGQCVKCGQYPYDPPKAAWIEDSTACHLVGEVEGLR